MKINNCIPLLVAFAFLYGCKPKACRLSGISGIRFGAEMSSFQTQPAVFTKDVNGREVNIPNGKSLYWFSRNFVFGGVKNPNQVRVILLTHKCKDRKENERAMFVIEQALRPYSRCRILANKYVARNQMTNVKVYQYCTDSKSVSQSVYVYTLLPEWKIMVVACDFTAGDINPFDYLIIEEK